MRLKFTGLLGGTDKPVSNSNELRHKQEFEKSKTSCINLADAHLDLIKGHVKDEGLVVVRVEGLLFGGRRPFLPLPPVQSQLHLHIRIYKQPVVVKFRHGKK